jgi:hypothetical protein
LLQAQPQIQKKNPKNRVIEARIEEDAKGNEEWDIPTHNEGTGMRYGVVMHAPCRIEVDSAGERIFLKSKRFPALLAGGMFK